MKRKNNHDMLPEYDFSKGVRGKYAARFAKGTNLVILEPDVAKVFSNSEIVNETLRAVVRIARQSRQVGIGLSHRSKKHAPANY